MLRRKLGRPRDPDLLHPGERHGMRLLFATSIKAWGGGEEWMLSACRGLLRRGHDVTLAARPGSAIRTRAARENIPLLDVPFRHDLDVVSFLSIYRFCRRQRPDLLCLNMDRVLRIAGSAARAAGVPCVLPRRGSEFPLKNGIFYRWSYRKIATGMIVNSWTTARTLLRDIPWRPAGNLHVLLNGVDLSRYANPRPRERTRAELGIPAASPVIITLGELTERKNPAAALRAMSTLFPRHPQLHALIVGEGPLRDSLEREAARGGMKDNVHFLGFRTDVPDLLHAGDILVHTARVEGFGYAVAEAMAAGLPVVAVRASSIPEIVDDGSTGILVEPDDDAALAAGIEAYLNDAERRKRDGDAGHARVRARFDLERRIDELEKVFEQEIRETNPTSRPGIRVDR
jgi:glycosyltransferase involved in cell wall biosynthesis